MTTATVPATSDAERLRKLEDQLEQVSIKARALEIAVFGSLHGSGYGWAWRKANAEERERQRDEADKLVARAKITPERVLSALAKAGPEAVRPVKVAVALMPALTDTSCPGRQTVVYRVGRALRELAAEGRVEQIRPDDYDGGRRHPHRYAVVDRGGRDDA